MSSGPPRAGGHPSASTLSAQLRKRGPAGSLPGTPAPLLNVHAPQKDEASATGSQQEESRLWFPQHHPGFLSVLALPGFTHVGLNLTGHVSVISFFLCLPYSTSCPAAWCLVSFKCPAPAAVCGSWCCGQRRDIRSQPGCDPNVKVQESCGWGVPWQQGPCCVYTSPGFDP